MRLVITLYALGLLVYPAWGLVSPETYQAELAEDYSQAASATPAQLQIAAALHWLKNAYLAFIFLLLARYLGRPEQAGDVKRAGALMLAFPVVLLVHQVLTQIGMSPDPEDLELQIRLRGEWLLYAVLGVALIGLARHLGSTAADANPQ